MKQRIVPLGAISKKKVFVLLSSVFIIPGLIFLSNGMVMPNEETHSTDNAVATPFAITPTILPTKWWIKTPALPLPTVPTGPINNAITGCPTGFSSPLQSGMYAYISLVPPLPNRVRAGAGKANTYLGQIRPGASVKIIDGPLCADGFSWWIVESVENDLQGWTATGSDSAQWVLPCPNPTVACKQTPLVSKATPTTASSFTQHNNRDTCISDEFSIGMLTQVKQDNLLVIRSEPFIGPVIGHAGPMSVAKITDGPSCAGGALWWEVNVPSLNLSGWAIEANLHACSKEDGCT